MNAQVFERFRLDVVLTSGGRELVKWWALVFMVLDHVDKTLFGGSLPWVNELSRMVFPLFAVVMAYGLATQEGGHGSLLFRLLAFGALAQPFHAVTVADGWLPLNILFTFAAVVGVVMALERRLWLVAGGVFLLAMPWVDYGLQGLWLVLSLWWFFRGGRWGVEIAAGGFVAICAFNGNAWAALALPVWLLLGRVHVEVPRWKWTFYAFYVGHLLLLAVLARVLTT